MEIQNSKIQTQGARWRSCATCGKPILVNVGSVDDRDGIRCEDCEIEMAWAGFRVLIPRDPQLPIPAELSDAAGIGDAPLTEDYDPWGDYFVLLRDALADVTKFQRWLVEGMASLRADPTQIELVQVALEGVGCSQLCAAILVEGLIREGRGAEAAQILLEVQDEAS